MKIEQLLEDIFSGIVDGPYEVNFVPDDAKFEIIFEEDADASRVVGKHGRTVSAISTIVNAFAKVKGEDKVGVTVSSRARCAQPEAEEAKL